MSLTEVDSTEVAEVIMDLGHTKEGKYGSREWVFTINNWTDVDTTNLYKIEARYKCWAPEVGAKGTPHIQGYIVFRGAKTRSAVSKLIPRAWVAARSPKSSPQNARNYIVGPYSKNGKEKPFNKDAVEVGTIPKQGERNDLKDFADAIKAGKRGRDISEDHLEVVAKYPRLEQRLINEDNFARACQQWRDGLAPEVHVYWGAPGTGKTRIAADKFGVENIFTLSFGDGCSGSIWWDGYQSQDIIVIDDYSGEFNYRFLLRFLDRYPVRLQIKGGYTFRVATKIYITSNCRPEQWHRLEPFEPLRRRITSITEVTDVKTEETEDEIEE